MTRSARRASGALALTLALALTAGACSDSEETPDEPGAAAAPSSSAPAEPAVETKVSFGELTGRLPRSERARVEKQIVGVVEGWTEAAYLGGDYPRDDFADSWPGFTRGAQALAKRDQALMSNQDIGDRIDGVELRSSRVVLDVLVREAARRRRDRPRAPRVPDHRRGRAHDPGPGSAVPDPRRRWLAGLRLRHQQGGSVSAVTRGRLRSLLRLGTVGLVLAGRGARGARLRGEEHRGRAGQDRQRRRGRPDPRRRVDPGRRLRRPAGRGHDPHPRRRAPAGRHEHRDRRGHRDRHPARLVGRRSRATAPSGSTPRSTSAARSCSARPSATWSASSRTTSSSPGSSSSRR